jgi:hypothetical protein
MEHVIITPPDGTSGGGEALALQPSRLGGSVLQAAGDGLSLDRPSGGWLPGEGDMKGMIQKIVPWWNEKVFADDAIDRMLRIPILASGWPDIPIELMTSDLTAANPLMQLKRLLSVTLRGFIAVCDPLGYSSAAKRAEGIAGRLGSRVGVPDIYDKAHGLRGEALFTECARRCALFGGPAFDALSHAQKHWMVALLVRESGGCQFSVSSGAALGPWQHTLWWYGIREGTKWTGVRYSPFDWTSSTLAVCKFIGGFSEDKFFDAFMIYTVGEKPAGEQIAYGRSASEKGMSLFAQALASVRDFDGRSARVNAGGSPLSKIQAASVRLA